MLAEKYGVSLAQATAMNSRVTGLAAEEGLDYHLEKAQHANTVKAHRLIHLAASKGRQDEALERVMAAYFTEGENVGDTETLARLAADAGLDADETRAALESDDYSDAVRADERRARCSALPAFHSSSWTNAMASRAHSQPASCSKCSNRRGPRVTHCSK